MWVSMGEWEAMVRKAATLAKAREAQTDDAQAGDTVWATWGVSTDLTNLQDLLLNHQDQLKGIWAALEVIQKALQEMAELEKELDARSAALERGRA